MGYCKSASKISCVNTLSRYLFREWFFAFSAALLVLLLISLGSETARLLADASKGDIPAQSVFQLIVYRIPLALELLLPLSALFSVVLVFGRFNEENEWVVMQSSGLGPRYFVRQVLLWMVPVALLTLVVVGFMSSWAAKSSAQLLERLSKSSPVMGLVEQTFVELGEGYVLYAQSISPQGVMTGVVLEQKTPLEHRWFKANQGGVLQKDDTLWLWLRQGVQYDGLQSNETLQLIHFAQMQVPLKKISPQSTQQNSKFAMTLAELWQSDQAAHHALLQWRLLLPFAVIVLGLWGLQLSKTKPRAGGRYGRLFWAILLFVVFYDLAYVLMEKVASGREAWWFGPYLTPIIFALPLFYLLRDQRGLS